MLKKSLILSMVATIIVVVMFVKTDDHTAANLQQRMPLIDTDLDFLPDQYEYIYGTNPRLWDTDGDTCSDGFEVNSGSDPLNAQIFPGVSCPPPPASVEPGNDIEIEKPGVYVNTGIRGDADSDGDGFLDSEEAANGTDPLDPCDPVTKFSDKKCFEAQRNVYDR